MDSRHHTGKVKQISWQCIVFLLALLMCCVAAEGRNDTVSCSEDEYQYKGFCCDMCSPGFKLVEKCLGKGLRSKCEKCSDGTYQDHTNHFPNCFSCAKPCDLASKEIEIAECTHKQDRQCGCQDGYYKKELNTITMTCDPCRKCGPGERETSPCLGNMNRVCDCKHNHYRVSKGICADCTNCSSLCSDYCPTVMPTERNPPTTGDPLQFILVALVCLLAVVALFCGLNTGFQHWKKRNQTLYSISPISCDPENQVAKIETHTCIQNKEAERSLLATPMDSVLPDCIPREIKTHEFIYFVLEVVPVSRFKELVRRLNVSEQDISRAEKDNRAFADAQYQMLMVWADSGTSGGKTILPRSLLQDCVDRLKVMNLIACAESIEEKCS